MKWFERKRVERSREDFERQQCETTGPKKPHQERYQRYVEEATRNLLLGDIDPEVSEEDTKFIQNHMLRDLYDDDECILLFEPAGE